MRGRRDDRDRRAGGRPRRLHGDRRDAEHRAAARRPGGRRVGARRGCRDRRATCTRRAASPKGRAGQRARADGRALRARRADLHRRRRAASADAGSCARALEYAASLPGAVIAQHAEDAALAGGGHMHEGEWSSRLGIPGRPAAAEDTIVARDCILAATHRRARALPAPVDRRRGRARCAPRRRAGSRSPPRPRRITSRSPTPRARRSTRSSRCNPPLRTRRRRRGGQGRAGRRHDRRHRDRSRAPRTEAKERPFEEAPPGMLGLETALALDAHRARRAGRAVARRRARARCRGGPAAIAGLADHGGPIAAGRRPRTSASSTRTQRWSRRRRRAREQGAQHAVRGPRRSPAGCATRSCEGRRSSSTARRCR